MKPAVRVEIDRLQAKSLDGRLMSRTVIDAARDKNNPLHDEYEWDKSKAHEIYLLKRTQELMAEYVEVVMHGEKAVKTRHLVSLTTDRVNGGGYRVLTQVMTDEIMRQQLLADALVEISSFQAKFQRLTELAEIFNAINAVQARYEKSPKKRRSDTRVAA